MITTSRVVIVYSFALPTFRRRLFRRNSAWRSWFLARGKAQYLYRGTWDQLRVVKRFRVRHPCVNEGKRDWCAWGLRGVAESEHLPCPHPTKRRYYERLNLVLTSSHASDGLSKEFVNRLLEGNLHLLRYLVLLLSCFLNIWFKNDPCRPTHPSPGVLSKLQYFLSSPGQDCPSDGTHPDIYIYSFIMFMLSCRYIANMTQSQFTSRIFRPVAMALPSPSFLARILDAIPPSYPHLSISNYFLQCYHPLWTAILVDGILPSTANPPPKTTFSPLSRPVRE